eukprot:8183006-Pyramimonas_sp.AAC.1
MPHTYESLHADDCGDQTRQDRAGQNRYLRRAPKRRAGPARGVIAQTPCMSSDRRYHDNEHGRKHNQANFS